MTTDPASDLTPDRRRALDRLRREDASDLGGCRGADLDELVRRGLAAVSPGRPDVYAGRPTVRATEPVRLLDTVGAGPCPVCGSPGFVVDGHPRSDGDPEGPWDYWLLRLDPGARGCVQTLPLPDGRVGVRD